MRAAISHQPQSRPINASPSVSKNSRSDAALASLKMAATTKHEILAGAAVKRFLELLEDAPRCQCGNSCETRMFLNRQLKSRDARANQIFADLFDEVL